MKILAYGDREALKKHGPEKTKLACYSRFVGDLIGASGCEIEDADVPLTFDEYKQLMADFPGWSYGRIFEKSKRWQECNWSKDPAPIHKLYDEAKKKRKYLLKKYKVVREQRNNLTI